MTGDEIENLVLARSLIESGLRLSIVQHLTGITTHAGRSLWREAYGQKPPNGKLPETSLYFMITSTGACTISAFAVFYGRLYSGKYALNARTLDYSYKEFRKIIQNFDINAGYRVVKDLSIGYLTLRRCPDCEASYVYTPEHKRADKCPFCIKRG